jgi:hypothetical protein
MRGAVRPGYDFHRCIPRRNLRKKKPCSTDVDREPIRRNDSEEISIVDRASHLGRFQIDNRSVCRFENRERIEIPLRCKHFQIVNLGLRRWCSTRIQYFQKLLRQRLSQCRCILRSAASGNLLILFLFRGQKQFFVGRLLMKYQTDTYSGENAAHNRNSKRKGH